MRLLAADFGDVLPLIVGVIALISWAVNKVKERAAGGAVGLAGGDEGGRRVVLLCCVRRRRRGGPLW